MTAHGLGSSVDSTQRHVWSAGWHLVICNLPSQHQRKPLMGWKIINSLFNYSINWAISWRGDVHFAYFVAASVKILYPLHKLWNWKFRERAIQYIVWHVRCINQMYKIFNNTNNCVWVYECNLYILFVIQNQTPKMGRVRTEVNNSRNTSNCTIL